MIPLVIDASAFLDASLTEEGHALLDGRDPVAPHLLRSESVSALHEMLRRGEVSPQLAALALDRIHRSTVRLLRPPSLHREAWRVAEELGWAKTYDAEYVALARLLRRPLLTLDGRLQRGAGRVVRVLGPADL